jgi:hypothetical protein
MKLEKLIEIASSAYPDGLVQQAFKSKKGVGDGLAEFIARELADTFDPKASDLDQMREAHRCMSSAMDQIASVVEKLGSLTTGE